MCRRSDYPPYTDHDDTADDDTAYDAAIRYATALGREDGAAAASWAYDGNTPREWYVAVRKGLADGDPAILDQLPAPDLSGQWAGTLTGPDLVRDAILASGADGTTMQDAEEYWFTDICDAYDDAFNDAVYADIERACAIQLDD